MLLVSTLLCISISVETEFNVSGFCAVFLGILFLVLESRGDALYTRRILPVSRTQIGLALWLKSVVYFPLIATASYRLVGHAGLPFDRSIILLGIINMGAAAAVVLALLLLARVIARPWPSVYQATMGIAGASVTIVGFLYIVSLTLVHIPKYDSWTQLRFGAMASLATVLSLATIRSLGTFHSGRHLRVIPARDNTVSISVTGSDGRKSVLRRAVDCVKKDMHQINPFANLHHMIQQLIYSAAFSALIGLITLGIHLYFYVVSEYRNPDSRSFMFSGAIPVFLYMGQRSELFSPRCMRLLPMRGTTLCAWLISFQFAIILPCVLGLALSSYLLDSREIGADIIATFAALVIASASSYQLVILIVSEKNIQSLLFVAAIMPLILYSSEAESIVEGLNIETALGIACGSVAVQFIALYYLIVRSSWLYRLAHSERGSVTKEL